MSASISFRRAVWPPLAFAACALAFAASRVPYDDEWYSIELAAEPDSALFWRALRLDMHPPWLALIDRALYGLWPSWHALGALRVLCAVVALALVVPQVAARLRVPQWLPWLAALHPIVLMYAASARWYPLVMLAQALRLYALWSADARSGTRAAAFAGGAALGACAGYLDALFVAHDAAFWLLSSGGGVASERGVRSGERRLVLGAGVAAGCALLALRVLSPLGAQHALVHALPAPALRPLTTFFGVGALYEAAPPWPWAVLALLVPLALGAGLLGCWRGADPPARAVLAYLASSGCAWLLATQLGAWHPRYALLWWWLLSACALSAAVRARPVRVAFASAGAYTALVLALMALGTGFVKADLNALQPGDCALLERAPAPALAVVPYPRLRSLIRAQCRLEAPLAGVPSIRIADSSQQQLAGVRRALAAVGARPAQVWLLRVSANSSLSESERRVAALLASRCRLQEREPFGAVPHARWKQVLRADAAVTRFVRERWTCR